MDKRIKAFMYGWTFACFLLVSAACFWSMVNGWTPITFHFNEFSEGWVELFLSLVTSVLWVVYIKEKFTSKF